MSLKMKKVLVFWVFSLFLVFSTITGAQAYSSILAFGDSLSDNGQYKYSTAVSPIDGTSFANPNNNNPYDYFGFKTFSNGKVWVDYIAEDLGVTSMLNMAYGGATSGWDDPAAGSPALGLQWQVAAYTTAKVTDTLLLRQVFGIQNALVTISAGANDNFNDRPADAAAQNIASAIESLYLLGGRDFLVLNLPDTNAWQSQFSDFLYTELSTLNGTYDDINLYILDWNKVDLTGLADDNIIMPDLIHPTTDHQRRIANIAWTAVPEPASILLLIVGFAGLAGVRRRMK